MNSTIELRTVPARPALLVHAQCPMSAIGATLGPIFGEVAAWAGAHHVPLAGPAVARYVKMDAGGCELDAGFLVSAAPSEPDPRVRATDLGGCTAVCATHIGPYDTVARTYEAIQTWMRANGWVAAGPMWEEYFSPPDTPPAEIRTDVYCPVRKG